MTTLQSLYEQVCDLRAAVAKETMQRFDIETGPHYQAIEKEIHRLSDHLASLRAEQQNLILQVPNSQSALAEAEKALFTAMAGEGKEVFGNAKLRYSNKSDVNKEKLLRELDGDLDTYLRLSSVTQKALKDWCQESGDKRLLSCIETVSTPVGLSFDS